MNSKPDALQVLNLARCVFEGSRNVDENPLYEDVLHQLLLNAPQTALSTLKDIALTERPGKLASCLVETFRLAGVVTEEEANHQAYRKFVADTDWDAVGYAIDSDD